MSTTSATHAGSTPGSSQAGATRNASGNAQRADKSTPSSADLFASLINLLGATFDAPLNADGTEATASGSSTPGDLGSLGGLGDAEEPSHNPLASLLSWPGAPVLQSDLFSQGQGAAAGLGNGLPAEAAPGTAKAAATGPAMASATGTTTASASTTIATDHIASDSTNLQGMTLLDQPVEADAELQASLAAATQGSAKTNAHANTTVRTDANAFAARGTSWRSTTALAHHAASATASGTPASTSQIQLGHMTQLRMATGTGPVTARSTLTLDDRFSATSLGEGTVSSLPGLNAPGHASPQGGSDQPPAGSGAFAEALDAERSAGGASESEFELMPENPAEEQEPEEFAPSPHQLRHASLRVGEGGEEAIDIQLALRGEQLNVDFRTDNAEARASLQHNASGTLSELLERGGIQLGQVSVGAQSQERQGQPAPRSPSSASSDRVGASDAGTGEDAHRPQAPMRRSDGSRPLDLFV